MIRLYLRMAWIVTQAAVETTIAGFSVIGLWTVARPYMLDEPQTLNHPLMCALLFLGTFWVAVGPTPYRRFVASDSSEASL